MISLLRCLRRSFCTVKITFLDRDGKTKIANCKIGSHLLQCAQDHDVSLEGACEASLACSTCHVVLEPRMYNMLPPATDEEDDLLDLAFGLSSTSRLGCQVKVTKEMEGCTVTVPKASRNMYVDGKKPAKH